MHETVLMGLGEGPPEVTQAEAEAAALEHFGLSGRFKLLRGERDRNFRISCDDGRDVMLKISHPDERHDVLDLQIAALRHIAAQDADLPVPRVIPAKKGAAVVQVDFERFGPLFVRAVTYLSGETLWDVPRTPELLREIGTVMARADLALRGFFHPGAGQDLIWDIRRSGDMAPHVPLIREPDVREAVQAALTHFVDAVLPRLSGLRAQVIHNDANLGNVLVEPGAARPFAGLIDFGDMIHCPLVAEPAVAAAELLIGCDDPVALCCALVQGYHCRIPLEASEVELLYDLIVTRWAVALAINGLRWDRQQDPEADYPPWVEPIRHSFGALRKAGREAVTEALFRALGMARPSPAASSDLQAVRARRDRLLGPELSLFYSKPVHILRGEGVWLYDVEGRRYLDTYNNVAQVGHCHPYVVQRTCEQIARLNTNVRYLHETILDYSERLTATLPDGLDVCVFVNSGSEANDVAWRMASAYTGHRGALILEHAYHGATEAVAALSPEEFPERPLAAHVRTLESPDPYRGRFGADDPDAGAAYAADADRAIGELDEAGLGAAAFFIDTSLCSNGIPEVPSGYLPAVAEKLRAAGGLLVADEVQYGFGRPRQPFLGFRATGRRAGYRDARQTRR